MQVQASVSKKRRLLAALRYHHVTHRDGRAARGLVELVPVSCGPRRPHTTDMDSVNKQLLYHPLI